MNYDLMSRVGGLLFLFFVFVALLLVLMLLVVDGIRTLIDRRNDNKIFKFVEEAQRDFS